ncbi:hypothetical protein MPRM_12480 [Mycobacterium parmense]|uniref:Uncharacterized protein n=1 Tax=Mycobacterium parmense TaxID=185642 RepID=A0A7I7YRU5_9MYCO|nr:hypothetical protein MPRM_12480 [Mycobacterium parmense]
MPLLRRLAKGESPVHMSRNRNAMSRPIRELLSEAVFFDFQLAHDLVQRDYTGSGVDAVSLGPVRPPWAGGGACRRTRCTTTSYARKHIRIHNRKFVLRAVRRRARFRNGRFGSGGLIRQSPMW